MRPQRLRNSPRSRDQRPSFLFRVSMQLQSEARISRLMSRIAQRHSLSDSLLKEVLQCALRRFRSTS
jgi:hypothetical protein